MTERTPEHANPERANAIDWLARARTFVLALVVALPPVLNAQNIVGWAHSPDGLGLDLFWSWVAFAGLDLIAAVCVIETLIQTERGRKAGTFAVLVWAFAAASAYAGYRHGTQPDVGRDVKWFFPFLALAGPMLLHLVLKRRRTDKQLDDGRRITHAPASAFGWARWIPGVGAFGETYCSWRVARLEGIVRPADAIARYRRLRPNAGRFGWRVLKAMRAEEPNTSNTDVKANTPNTQPVAPIDRPERQAIAERAVVRSIESARHKPNSKPNAPRVNGDTALNLKAIKQAHPQWRTNMPSVRQCAAVLSVAVSTGKGYRDRLIAEANTPPPVRPEQNADDEPERASA